MLSCLGNIAEQLIAVIEENPYSIRHVVDAKYEFTYIKHRQKSENKSETSDKEM